MRIVTCLQKTRMYITGTTNAGGARRLALLFALAIALAPQLAVAQSKIPAYPERPIKLVVPFPPGGTTDTLARTLAEGLRADLGQPVIIDNRSGAGGLIGTDAVKTAPADGYVLLLTSLNNHVMLPLIQRTSFQPERDLASIGLAVQSNTALLVSNAVPSKTLAQFVEYARQNPGRMNYSSSGNGSFGHFFTELFKSQAHIDVAHVPYKGAAPSAMALYSNEVQLLIVGYSAVQSNAEAGQMRVLAQDGDVRSALLPNVPTFAEAGFPEFRPTFWLGLSAPKDTPPVIIARLNQAMNTILRSPEFAERARKNGWTPLPGTPADMDKKIASDLGQYGAVVRRLKIRAD